MITTIVASKWVVYLYVYMYMSLISLYLQNVSSPSVIDVVICLHKGFLVLFLLVLFVTMTVFISESSGSLDETELLLSAMISLSCFSKDKTS